MGQLDIDQAARQSGLSARDVRLRIEAGTLPATRPAGRWLIEEHHLAATATTPGQQSRDPGPAAPVAPLDQEREELGTLLARLEEASAEIAELRTERDELRLRLREQVSSLQRSLDDSMEELDEARARLAESERRGTGAGAGAGTGTRAALTPLFRATTDVRDRGR